MIAIRFYIGLSSPNDPGATHAASRRAIALSILSNAYAGGTAVDGTGYWEGAEEPSLVFETVQPDELGGRAPARDVARVIARQLGQDCVGLAFLPVQFELIGKDGAL